MSDFKYKYTGPSKWTKNLKKDIKKEIREQKRDAKKSIVPHPTLKQNGNANG